MEINLSVSAESYSQLKTFLANVEKSSRLMDPTALRYTPSGSSYTITFRTYYQPEKVTIDASGQDSSSGNGSPPITN
jgi:hypothetical protein